jgi:cathepsin L
VIAKTEDFALSTEIDWVKSGKVTSIKAQGSCNGCYSFAAAAAIESAYLIAHRVYYDLSEQQILDCSF